MYISSLIINYVLSIAVFKNKMVNVLKFTYVRINF